MPLSSSSWSWLRSICHHFGSLDLRSLALFRILLGASLLLDLYIRLSLGKYDLAWYTSVPAQRSYLHVDDTPHKAPLHQYWFYRGSATFQTVAFGVSGLLATLFLLGWGQQQAGGILKLLLWLVIVSQGNRNMESADGSDSYIRHLLLWSCFLPLADVWSVDAYLQQGRRRRTSPRAPL